MQPVNRFEPLFRPQSIALVQAEQEDAGLGQRIATNIVDAGYRGKLFLVNPGAAALPEHEFYPSCANLPESPDLGIVTAGPKTILPVLEALGKAGVNAVIVASSGFQELGLQGEEIRQQMAQIAIRWAFILLGPHSLGVLNPAFNLNASTLSLPPIKGKAGFFSQSSALCSSMLDWAADEHVGFSKFLSLGDKFTISEADALEALGEDPETKVILGYLESVENGREFVRIAQQVTEKKPVIMIKAGTTPAGCRAAACHTGSATSSIDACSAAFAQSGIIPVEDTETLFDLARAFSSQPLPLGQNLTIVTNSGGPGILVADNCEQAGLQLPAPTQETQAALQAMLPTHALLTNPIDMLGSAGAQEYRHTLELVANDPATHTILVLITPNTATQSIQTAHAIKDIAQELTKPIFACVMGGKSMDPARELLKNAGIPCYIAPEPAVRSIAAMVEYQRWRTRPWPVEVCFRRDKAKAGKLLRKALREYQPELRHLEALEIAMAYELPIPESKMARTSDQAVKAAKKLGYPVALKLVSPDIPHPGEQGAMALNLETPFAVRAAFQDITNRVLCNHPQAYIAGCLVQTMGPLPSRQVRIRLRQDSQFGPMVGFSMAGSTAEILHDEAWRLAPLTLQDAQQIVESIRSYPILKGEQGHGPVHFGALEDCIMSISQMAHDFPQILDADIGPVLVDEQGAFVTDLCLTVG